MSESTVEPMRELRVWLRESDYLAVKTKAAVDGVSQSELARQAIAKHLGEDAAGQSAPWLADMLDAVLAKYFQEFPRVLGQLVESAFEQREYARSLILQTLKIDGERDRDARADRLEKLHENITAHAHEKAADFFESLSDEQMIRRPEPADD